MEINQNPFDKIDNRFDITEALLHDIRKRLDMPSPHERLTRKMVCIQYHVSLGTVHNAMKSGKLKFDKIGTKTIFKRVDVELWATFRK